MPNTWFENTFNNHAGPIAAKHGLEIKWKTRYDISPVGGIWAIHAIFSPKGKNSLPEEQIMPAIEGIDKEIKLAISKHILEQGKKDRLLAPFLTSKRFNENFFHKWITHFLGPVVGDSNNTVIFSNGPEVSAQFENIANLQPRLFGMVDNSGLQPDSGKSREIMSALYELFKRTISTMHNETYYRINQSN